MRLATSRAAALCAAFALAGLLAARLLGIPVRDAWILVRNSALASILAAVLGSMLLARSGRPSLRRQTVTAALTLIGVVVAGIVAAAASMFLSGHDFRALVVVAIVATGVSLGVALRLAARVGEDATIVEHVLRDGTDPGDALDAIHSKEMHALAQRLHEASVDLVRSSDRERAVERSRRELVAWISHDLRSPLASIRALAEALEDDIVVDPDDVQRYYRTIRRETERLSALVDDLFELSRVQAGAVVAAPSQSVSMADVIDDAVAGVGGLAATKNVAIVCPSSVVEHVSVPAADALRIVRNLLDNAVRHTPEGGAVRLDVWNDDHGVCVRVDDECGGIPADELPRVFDVAFRGDAARGRRDSSGGGGLGLAIARGLAEAHAGAIDVCNTGPGCRFELRMPRVGE